MCLLTVAIVTSLTVPAPVVAQTGMSSKSEDSDSQKMGKATLHFGLSQPSIINLVVIVMLVEVGPLMQNVIIQRLNLMQLCKT